MPRRIVYFGLPLGALALARAGAQLVGVCIGHPDAQGMRRVLRTLGPRTLVLGRPDVADDSIVHTLSSTKPDAILSWFWPRLIPQKVLELAPLGAWGVHPSLLPRWRGPDPYFWALRSGDVTTGVTLHRLAPDYDTGEIVAQRTIAIEPHDDAWSLARRLDRPGLALLLDAARSLEHARITGAAQDARTATDAPAPTEQDLAIDWHAPSNDVLRLIRAASPEPAATAMLAGVLVEILRARSVDLPIAKALMPAEAVWTRSGILVRAKEAGVEIVRARFEDGRVIEGAELGAWFRNATQPE